MLCFYRPILLYSKAFSRRRAARVLGNMYAGGINSVELAKLKWHRGDRAYHFLFIPKLFYAFLSISMELGEPSLFALEIKGIKKLSTFTEGPS